MISSLSVRPPFTSCHSTPPNLSRLNRTAFVVQENAALLQAFQSADWATQWATLCFMQHAGVLDLCAGIWQAAQNAPLLADALGDWPLLDPSCRFVSDVLRSEHGVPDAFGRAFGLALLAALSADTNERLTSCLAVLSAGGLSSEMKLAAWGAVYSLPLDDEGKARVAACAPEEGVRKQLLESFEAAGMSSLNLNSVESDLTPQSEVTESSISPVSHSGTFRSFGLPDNGQPITPISQTGANGNSFHISLISMQDASIGPSEMAEEEKKSASPRLGPQ